MSGWIFKRLETKPINLRTHNLVLGCEVDLTVNVFNEMGVTWAEIADQNQTEKQLLFLKTLLKPDGYVLDLACGTGRHSIPLTQQGYNMVGFDVSANLLQIARQRSKELQLVRGDMRFLPFKTQTLAAAISMDTSFGYLPSEADDAVSLVEVKRALNQKGIFVIDVFNREKLILKYQNKNPPAKWKQYPSFFLLQKRTLSSEGGWLWDLWTIQDKESGQVSIFEHAVRLYECGKLESMLEMAGFVVKDVYGGYNEENFSSNSQRLILIAQAK
jgi:SAM-dependent methyltransferase